MKLGLKVNKKELLNTTLGILAVKYSPELLKKVLPEYAYGITGNILAGAVGVAVGVAMKNQTIQNVAIATALVELLADNVIDPMMTKTSVAVQTTNSQPQLSGLKNYVALKDFPQTLTINKNYKSVYA